jgi:hypothetical protein
MMLLIVLLATTTTAVASSSSSCAASASGAASMQVVAPWGKEHDKPSRMTLPPATMSRNKVLSTQTTKTLSVVLSALPPRGGSSGYHGTGFDDDDDDPYDSGRSTRQGGYTGGIPYGDDDDNHRRYDDHYDDDRGRRRPSTTSTTTTLPRRLSLGGANRSIGVPLLGAGGVLTVLGVSLFFNKTLMRLGNLCFVFGSVLTLGPGRTASYFLQPKKARATACLVMGLLLVFVGWPVLGIVLEIFGLLNLFGNMFPLAMAILRQMPFIGPLLKGDFGNNKNGNSRRDDYYADDGRYYDRPNDGTYDNYRADNDDDYRGYY